MKHYKHVEITVLYVDKILLGFYFAKREFKKIGNDYYKLAA